MSESNLPISERLSRVATAADQLTATVQGQLGKIDKQVDAKSKEVDLVIQKAQQDINHYLSAARGEYSHILLSRNQRMEPMGQNAITGFNTIYLDKFEVIKEATIHASAQNDIDHTGNGVAKEFRDNVFSGYVNGYFNILRLKWLSNEIGHPSRFDDNWSSGYQQGSISTGCYLKVVAGKLGGALKPYVNYSNDWQLMGMRQSLNGAASAFYAPHSKLTFEGEGEALICLFGTASGFVNFENKEWGIYPEFARPALT
ncbi:hypothetical protein NI389_13885 [Pseudoalteromonas xiamenensis]|uniref:hypothetical protein n=1 Tax=Pseudoalteromonas xiamenensis TaxID=882626 RepID=UPI0027E48864|nr:hypothetical protein [Pseudoalteromonas xiamenensis]WMN59291.1 hypothetical protein NI389_13885 [Pseudoalteromonas xiamenensis]